MRNVYDINAEFESKLCQYTGAPYAVSLDCCSNAIFLALKWAIRSTEVPTVIGVPQHTYPSVPAAVIHAGREVRWIPNAPELTGEYQLIGTNVWDSALTFRKNMYRTGMLQCLSFNSRKHLKLPSGGAILTDSYDAYQWFKKMRFSGRNEVDYLVDTITEVGWRMYMLPEIAAQGLKLMTSVMEHPEWYANDLTIKYPNLAAQPAYKPWTS